MASPSVARRRKPHTEVTVATEIIESKWKPRKRGQDEGRRHKKGLGFQDKPCLSLPWLTFGALMAFVSLNVLPVLFFDPSWDSICLAEDERTVLLDTIPTLASEDLGKPDYGGLNYVSVQSSHHFFRRIHQMHQHLFEKERERSFQSMEHEYEREEHQLNRNSDPDGLDEECRLPKWASEKYPNCNTVHELTLERLPNSQEQVFDVQYLAQGYYRQTFLLSPIMGLLPHNSTFDRLVLKHLRYSKLFSFNEPNMEAIHNEARVMNALSPSRRFSDLYGFCATTVLVEAAKDIATTVVPKIKSNARGRMGQAELDTYQVDDVHPFNSYSPFEKLVLLISMAESLAALHGFSGGVIVHDDVYPDQWLQTYDGRVVLNDVNNAIPLKWNSETQRYCKAKTRFDNILRAPEELRREPVDELVDVWPFGNMIFSVLTGLWPYYDTHDEQQIRETVVNGTLPSIDPRYETRSLIEGRLFDLMWLCYKIEPNDRVDMAFIVSYLHQTLQSYRAQVGDLPESMLIL